MMKQIETEEENQNGLWIHEEHEYRLKVQTMTDTFQLLVDALLEKGETLPHYRTAGKWLANNGYEILRPVRKSL